MLDSIIDCDRQIVFSRERERRQIAPSPGCSCLPWKCVCVYLVLERDIPFFLSLCSKKKERVKKKCEMLCAWACVRVEHTCYEVAARRGLRNNPSVISISKPHLCVWLNMKSQLPLLAFVEQLMPNLAKKKKKNGITLFFVACVDAPPYFKLWNCFGKSGILHPKGFGLCQRTLHTHTGSCALIRTRPPLRSAPCSPPKVLIRILSDSIGPFCLHFHPGKKRFEVRNFSSELFSERCETLD